MKANANVNDRDRENDTPLIRAAYSGHLSTCQYLVSLPLCFVGAKDEEGKTAVEHCCTRPGVATNPELQALRGAHEAERKEFIDLYAYEWQKPLLANNILDFSIPKLEREQLVARVDKVMDTMAGAVTTLLQQKTSAAGAIGEHALPSISAEEIGEIKENVTKTIADKDEFKRAMMHVLLQRASGHISEYLFDYDKLTFEEGVHAKMYIKRQHRINALYVDNSLPTGRSRPIAVVGMGDEKGMEEKEVEAGAVSTSSSSPLLLSSPSSSSSSWSSYVGRG